MVLEQLVYCPEGNITIAGSKITSTAPIRGEQTLIRIEDSTLEIDNQLDEYSAMDTNMTEESGLEVHRSDIKLKSVGSNTFGGRFVIYDSNVEAEIEKAPERFPDRDKRNTNAFDLKDYPNVLVTNSSMKLNGIQSGILMERGNLNIVGSDIEAEGNIGFYVYKGDISVVGGKLKLNDLICAQKNLPDAQYRPEDVKNPKPNLWAQTNKLAQIEKKMPDMVG